MNDRRAQVGQNQCGNSSEESIPAIDQGFQKCRVDQKRFMEIRHTFCLLMGWMDEGKTTPKWAKTILDMIFKS